MKPSDDDFLRFKKEATLWAQERLADPNSVVVDVETTGILRQDPDAEIVQISILNMKERALLSMLVKPNKPCPDEVVAIHGIDNDQLMSAPMFSQIHQVISFMLEGKHVIAYNADFDIQMLIHLFRKYDKPAPKFAGVSCCMDRYSEWCGEWSAKKEGFKWQKLPKLAAGQAHDSFVDCLSTIKVMQLMAGEFDPTKVSAEEIELDF